MKEVGRQPLTDVILGRRPRGSRTLSPKIRGCLAAIPWTIATSAAAFAGGAAMILVCSQRTDELWLAKLHTLVLLPSILLYFLFDSWRPESRAKWFGLAVPFLAAACFLAAVADVLPHRCINGTMISQHAIALAGSLGGAWLVLRAKRHAQTFKLRRFQFGLSSLFVLGTLVALLCAGIKMLGPIQGSLLFGWSVAAILIMIAFQGTEATPRGGWLSAFLLAIAAVYGPFVAMFVNTWLFNPSHDCMQFWLKFLWVAPGGMIETLIPLLLFRTNPGIPPVLAIAIAAVFSAGLVAGATWLARRIPLVRWISLAVLAFLAGLAALAADALLRA
jgi:hypothetical protein